MRLTLRTLLAYLDDTLEPTQAKLIGQKVAESDTAQELIARIKEVTRRRRISAPTASGPGAKVDPNSIAEYLDNELSADQLAEIEQLALDSDVHLAEIASCHQVLTIVLGEPAVVPPSAVKRMYGLVKPPASNPNRRPPAQAESEADHVEGVEVDETLRLGLPAWRLGSGLSNSLIVIGGAVCIVALLGVAIWQLLPQFGARDAGGSNATVAAGDSAKLVLPGEALAAKDKGSTKADTEPKEKAAAPKDKSTETTEKTNEPKDKGAETKDKGTEAKEKPVVDAPPPPPDLEVREVGIFEAPSAATTVLMQKTADTAAKKAKWTRLLRATPPAKVLSNSTLVSLPGYRSVVQSDRGVRLTLWGNVPEYSPIPPAVESVVTLHPSSQVDLDFTLERGRIILFNPKEQPLTVRLRFANPTNPAKSQIWDITLETKGTEVVANLCGIFPAGELFYPKRDNPERKGPVAVMVLLVTNGAAHVKADLQPPIALAPPPEGVILTWFSAVGEIVQNKGAQGAEIPRWAIDPAPPLPKDFPTKPRADVKNALGVLNGDLTNTPVDRGLLKAMQSSDIALQRLAVRSAGALDDLPRVIDALDHKEIDVRRAAIETLRLWNASAVGNDYRLFDQLKTTYSEQDASLLMSLLHTYSPQQESDPNFGDVMVRYLVHKKVAIRELAHDYLLRLYPAGAQINYSATAPEPVLQQGAKLWYGLMQQQSKEKK
jgi:hypothetical protein